MQLTAGASVAADTGRHLETIRSPGPLPRPRADAPADREPNTWRGPAAGPNRLLAGDVLGAIDQGIALFDLDDRLIVANAVYKRIFASIADIIKPGVAFETLIRTAAARCQNVDAIADPEAWVRRRLQAHRAASGVYEHKFADGRWIQVRERRTATGQIIGTYTDITPLMQRTEELVAARDRLDTVSRRMKGMIEASSDWIWTSDAAGRVTCEPQTSRQLEGFDPAPHIATALRALLRAVDVDGATPRGGTALRQIVYPAELGGGRIVYLKINGKAVWSAAGVFEGYIGTASDETEKIAIQQEAAQHTAVLEGVLHSIVIGVIVFAPDRSVVMCNHQAGRLLGEAVQPGTRLEQLQECLGRERVEYIVQWSAQGTRPGTKPLEFNAPAGKVVVARANLMSTGGFVMTLADVTEQRRAAEVNHQSQKLMALGQLAGGVAHEFNNLLTSIGGFAQMARQFAAQPATVTECVDEVLAAAGRAADLTRQMLTFSRKNHSEEKTVVAAEIAHSLAKMIKPLLPETVKLEVLVEDHATCIRVDAAQISQALMNLILNARDALPKGGIVVLKVQRGAEAGGADPGPRLIFSVADNGTGIDEAALPRIFDPFFTTKELGKGTGLGLSVVHGIVQRSGGSIAVDSKLGQGTTFSIFLPVAEGAASEPPLQPAPAARGGGATVAVVEDEPGVRRWIVRSLESQGYRVVAAADEASLNQALQACEALPAVLLTDVVLPGKSGPEIAAALRGRIAGIKVLFMSGYVAPEIADRGLIGEDAVVLSKPFEPEALHRAIADALTPPSAAAQANRETAAPAAPGDRR
jgi:signal transduction histidine kinase/CheY-like chemotaxis protein